MTTDKKKKTTTQYVPEDYIPTVGYSSTTQKPTLDEMEERQTELYVSRWCWRHRITIR